MTLAADIARRVANVKQSEFERYMFNNFDKKILKRNVKGRLLNECLGMFALVSKNVSYQFFLYPTAIVTCCILFQANKATYSPRERAYNQSNRK